MVEPISHRASTQALCEYMAQQRGPLMAGPEWSVVQTLNALRSDRAAKTLHYFFSRMGL